MRMRPLFLLFFLVFAAFLPATPASADSWAAPRRATYHSANREVRLVVTPHIPSDRNRWPFSERPRGVSARGSAHAVLQRRERGEWRTQWRGALRNEIMPVSAMVADSGRYFVTFDDWGGTGFGPNVVVIYDGAGRTVRALSILDLLPDDYVRTLPRSFSSVYWGGEHRFSADGGSLLLSIGWPSEELFAGGGGPLTLEVELATGQPIPPSGDEWTSARDKAVRLRAAQRAREAQRLAYMTEPLLGPTDGTRGAWEMYLTEAYYRLYPGPVHPTGWALEPPGAPRYADTRDFVAMILLRSRLTPQIAVLLGSPDEEDLIRFLAETLAQIRPETWRDGTLYVAAHDANWPRIAALIAPTGATPVQIDPTEPIPQLPARLRRYVETGASGPLTPAESAQD